MADLIVARKLEHFYAPYRRDYIYVEDVARTIATTAVNDVVGLYHLGRGKAYSTEELVQAFSPGAGMEIEPLPDYMVEEIVAPKPYHPDLKLTWDVADWLRYVSPY